MIWVARQRSENRDKAYELWLNWRGEMPLTDIAEKLGVSDGQVRKWKCQDKWTLEARVDSKGNVTVHNGNVTKRRGSPFGSSNGTGGPIGNKKAAGHKGRNNPGNQNAAKHGLYSKYLPRETYEIAKGISGMSPLDILWGSICMKYAAILRAQKIMHVEDKDDMTKVLKRTKDASGTTSVSREREYELQFAWDKQGAFLQAQAKAMRVLTDMIKQYEEMCKSEAATEEQQLRIAKLRIEVDAMKNSQDKDDDVRIIDDLEVNDDGCEAE